MMTPMYIILPYYSSPHCSQSISIQYFLRIRRLQELSAIWDGTRGPYTERYCNTASGGPESCAQSVQALAVAKLVKSGFFRKVRSLEYFGDLLSFNCFLLHEKVLECLKLAWVRL